MTYFFAAAFFAAGFFAAGFFAVGAFATFLAAFLTSFVALRTGLVTLRLTTFPAAFPTAMGASASVVKTNGTLVCSRHTSNNDHCARVRCTGTVAITK